MKDGSSRYVHMNPEQEIEHGELAEDFKCRVTRPLVGPCTIISLQMILNTS